MGSVLIRFNNDPSRRNRRAWWGMCTVEKWGEINYNTRTKSEQNDDSENDKQYKLWRAGNTMTSQFQLNQKSQEAESRDEGTLRMNKNKNGSMNKIWKRLKEKVPESCASIWSSWSPPSCQIIYITPLTAAYKQRLTDWRKFLCSWRSE